MPMYRMCISVSVYVSRTEQNEHAQSSGWLCGAGVPGGAAGREDRGTHHLLQSKGDDADEGKQLLLDWTVSFLSNRAKTKLSKEYCLTPFCPVLLIM